MTKIMMVSGQASTRQVWIKRTTIEKERDNPTFPGQGRELLPARSQRFHNHSPDGFAWGYGGSGPAQLALALCLRIFEYKRAPNDWVSLPFDYQQFKWDIIAKLNIDDDFMIELDLEKIRELYKRTPFPPEDAA